MEVGGQLPGVHSLPPTTWLPCFKLGSSGLAASGLEPSYQPLYFIFWLDMLEGHLEIILGVILKPSQDTRGAIVGTDDYFFVVVFKVVC